MAQTVGIFSRSGEREFSWLANLLREHCQLLPFYISNDNRVALLQHIDRCQLAILYHTRNRGRINIADVTDSLYDEEINLMSDKLGKEQVLVVIDDLEDSSEGAKETILNSQPTLRTKAHDIFLFSALDKDNSQALTEKVQPIINLIKREEKKAGKIGHWIENAVVVWLSSKAMRRAFHTVDDRHIFLAGLWTAGLARTFLKKPSEPFLFNLAVRSVVSWGVTLVTLYNAYSRPNARNTILPLWIIASLSLPHQSRQSGFKRCALKTMGYSLVLYTFSRGWQMRNTTDISKLIVQTVLCSPVTLAVV